MKKLFIIIGIILLLAGQAIGWSGSASTSRLKSSTTLPSTCRVGDLYLDTDADTNGTVYFCRATDTWKDIDDDGSSASLPADPGADGILFWDDSDTGTEEEWAAIGTGLYYNGTTLTASAILQEYNAVNPDAAGLTINALTDPGADRVAFWDDSASAYAHLTIGSGLTLTDTTLTAAGGATAWDDIGNPDADTTIANAGYETTITSSLDEAGHNVLLIDHTDADVAALTTIFKIKAVDDGQANLVFLDFIDDSGVGSNSVFKVQADGKIMSDSNVHTIGGNEITFPSASGTLLPSIDEDNMVSDSASHVPTQQSVKAYVDGAAVAPTNITPVDTADDNATFYVLLVDGATGSQATETDSTDLSYNAYTNILTVEGGIESSSVIPTLKLKDSDASAGDDNYTLGANASDTGDGTEDIDVTEQIQIAGTSTTVRHIDADGDYEIGTATMNTQVVGDLTITGDDLFMTTNTDGMILVADGTNFNPVQVSGDVEITNAGATTVEDDAVQPDDIEYIVEESYIPVSYMTDGASAPDALATITSGTDKVDARTFAGDADEDLLFIWQAPQDLDTTSGVKFRVICLVSAATGPSTETWQFEMHGFSLGDGDALDGTLGTAMTSNSGSRTDAQYDRVATAISSAMTSTHITGLAAGETVHFKLYRDVDDTDTYVQNVAVLGVELKYKRNLVTTF